MDLSSPLDALAPTHCICYTDTEGCVCPDTERTLRAYAVGAPMPPMTPEQREYCLEQIHYVEGYDRRDYEEATDQMLASGVLHAWLDYCRDKGLL